MVPRLVLIVAWWALLVSIVNSGGFDHFFGIGLSLSCWMLTVDRRTKTRRAPCRVVQGQDIRPILLKPSRLGKSLVMVKRTRTTFHRPIPRSSITATTNDHQPKANDHQPRTTNQAPSTNNQAPTTNKGRSSSISPPLRPLHHQPSFSLPRVQDLVDAGNHVLQMQTRHTVRQALCSLLGLAADRLQLAA